MTANAYLGAWGIADALDRGADVVITGRVTDAAVVVGPAASRFGWARTDWDALAGAVAAGHVIECGAQCTGGNFAFFGEVPDLERPGFPIAEIHHDGSFVVTKHPGYGRSGVGRHRHRPAALRDPGARLPQPRRDRGLRQPPARPGGPRPGAGVRGGRPPAPDSTKVAVNYLGGYRNSMTFVHDRPRHRGQGRAGRADVVVPGAGRPRRRRTRPTSTCADPTARIPADQRGRAWPSCGSRSWTATREGGAGLLERGHRDGAVELPRLFTTSPPGDASSFGVYWPALIPDDVPVHEVVLDGERTTIAPLAPEQRGELSEADAYTYGLVSWNVAAGPAPVSDRGGLPDSLVALLEAPQPPDDPTFRAPLGAVFGARSGDKGGNANLGVWARRDDAYVWLHQFLTVERLRQLMPAETEGLEVRRFELPNLRALNFVIMGLLGRGVAASTRLDPQAKGLGEYLRAKVVDLPTRLADGTPAATLDHLPPPPGAGA